jgi:hypothetical protein
MTTTTLTKTSAMLSHLNAILHPVDPIARSYDIGNDVFGYLDRCITLMEEERTDHETMTLLGITLGQIRMLVDIYARGSDALDRSISDAEATLYEMARTA